MDLLELKEPNKVINYAIDIIEELESNTTRQLIKINNMSKQEREKLGNEYIVNVCLVLKQYQTLIKDLEKVRDFASEQFVKVFRKEI